ncbi:MAG: trypsin-like peptidase domain-containing protein [Spirochaeta sp.]|nr:trypsin-like peptidase domain-containing protein [Spirochaeta sp.]
MKESLAHTTGRRYGMIVVIATALLLGGCASAPEETHEPFTRSSRLISAIEDHLTDDEYGAVVNRVQYGVTTGLLSDTERSEYLQQYVTYTRERYDQAVTDGEYREALKTAWNLRLLARHLPDEPVSYTTGDLATTDQLLADWATFARENDDAVLSLYLILRRDQISDLSGEDLIYYIGVAREMNHDEAVGRLTAAARRRELVVPLPEDPVDADGDEPGLMLPGTVTIWVNKGIRVDRGVGVPDRVIGSGFFVDPRGYLITNYHVIQSEVDPTYEGYSRLFVKLPGRPDERVPARVIGYDRIFDLALLKVEIDPKYVFSLSDIKTLVPGQRVLAFGSPGGLDSTITSGIISASGRRFLQMGEAMQVDVPINPGNSGGPLVLPSGQVAGVVFAGLEQFEGVNFAIPTYWIRHFFPQLFEEGEVKHAWLGISVRQNGTGLEAVYVAPGSPADRAGVEPGEVLTHINGETGLTLADAQDQLLGIDAGYLVHTVWQKTEEDDTVSTTQRIISVGVRPYSPVEEALERQPIEALFPVLFGMQVDDVSGAPWGPDFVITDVFPGSVADESSLSVDDPFALRTWRVDSDLRAAFIQIIIKKRKAGFIESGVQLGAYLETDSFL